MQKLYIVLLLFTAFFASAEPISTKETKLPEFFKTDVKSVPFNNLSIFYDQNMAKRKLEDIENKLIIVHFWASWNMPSLNELIALNKLQKDFRKKALLVFAISEDFKGIEAIDTYFSKHKLDYLDIYLDKKHKIYESLNINHLPVSYIFDFNGNLLGQSTPGETINWQDEDLRNYLEEKVSKFQLLPPEYKKTRDKYEPPKQTDEKIPPIKKVKQSIFIN